MTTALSPSALANFPPAGVDEFKSAAVLEIDLTTIGGPILSITVVGPTRITRSDPFDPGDGKQMIATEIVSMVLNGGSPDFPITVLERGDRQSRGMIQQKTPDNWFPADSFFDVWIEVETPLGTFLTNEPIRLFAMIDEIPPFQAQYQPDGAFIGVDLFDPSGSKVGVLRHAAHFVSQHPSFSVADRALSTLSPSGLFDVPTTATPKIPPVTGLGIEEEDELDALSYGTDFIADLMEMRFSVDPDSVGAAGHVLREAAKDEAHGDEFWVSLARFASNVQELDEDGSTAPPFPLQLIDDVASLTEPPTSFVDPDGNQVPENPVYFSLGTGSPSLDNIPGSPGPGDILETVGGGPPSIFIPFDQLGLEPDDDLDALCLGFFLDPDNPGELGKAVLFSLAPDSPTLTMNNFSPADLFAAAAAPGSQKPPFRFAIAPSLGLLPSDNLNALKCTLPRVDRPPHSVMRLKCNDEEIDLWGYIKILIAVGPNGEAFRSDPIDFVQGELVQMSLHGTGSLGPVNVRVRPLDKFPNQRSRIFVQDEADETREDTPEFLDVGPWREGEASYFLDLFVEIDYNGQTLHHSIPINLHGIVSRLPPAEEEPLQQFQGSSINSVLHDAQGTGTLSEFAPPSSRLSTWQQALNDRKEDHVDPIDLFTEDGQPSGFSISDVVFWLNLPLPAPNVNPNGVVNAASFQLGSPPETIMSLFGTTLSDRIESNAGLPLPTELAGTSVTVTDSNGNQAVAALSTGPTNLSTLSSLFFVAPNQLNFFMPADLAFGPATVTVMTEDGNSSSTTVAVVPCNPGLFAANDQGFGVAKANFVRGNTDGSQNRGLLFNPATLQAVPVDLGPEGAVVFLELFGTGMRGCSSAATATLAGDAIPAFGPVAVPGFIGLDQANVGPISRDNIGAGEVNVVLNIDGIEVNTVTVAIQ